MLLKNKKVTVLCGGNSQERSISLQSGKSTYDALTRIGYTVCMKDPIAINHTYDIGDLAFLALHGPGYEDGTLQKQLDTNRIPYTGNGYYACQVSANKQHTKQLCQSHHLPSPLSLHANTPLTALPPVFHFPVITKPLYEGSSIDVMLIETAPALEAVSTQLIKKYGEFLLEEFIEGKEITVSIVENPHPVVLPILELIPRNTFYDYEAKYTKGMTQFIVPATLSDQETATLHTYALQLFKILRCTGYARIDFRLCPKRGPFILELNAMPGLTSLSDLPLQAQAMGWHFDDLVDIMLSSAYRRYQTWQQNT